MIEHLFPLDNTVSVLDFVSYPRGNGEDRARSDISGMNLNAALSGGRAQLVIAASCWRVQSLLVSGHTTSTFQASAPSSLRYDSQGVPADS